MSVPNNAREWTVQHDDWLGQIYSGMSNTKIAGVMGRTPPAIQNRAIKLGLKKSPEYMKREKPGCFKKGGTSWNKGIHFNSGGRSVQTRFKSGAVPANQLPVGAEVVDNYGYRKRKVRDDAPKGKGYQNWKFVHVIVWEQHNGPLPKGRIVRFRDSNIENLAPGNLVDLSRGENCVINRWIRMGDLPEGGMDVLITMAKLKIAARKRQEELA
ncbi:MAG: HNH endonuclease signature motif containing protein [Marinobacter sp.]